MLCIKVDLSVWDVSQLAVSIYPRFSYDAIGAGGPGDLTKNHGSLFHVEFDVSKFEIPPLNYQTAKVLGVPLPPPLQIDIKTQRLEVPYRSAPMQRKLKLLCREQWMWRLELQT